MRNPIAPAANALTFLTIFGSRNFGQERPPTPATIWWFAPIGATIGAALAAIHWGTHELWPAAIAGIAVIAADLIITGALHIDGTADTADGLAAHKAQPQRLEIMAEPAVGAFGIAAVVTVLLLRASIFAQTSINPVSIIAIWALSRILATLIMASLDYVRPHGLAKSLSASASWWLALWLLPPAAALVVVADLNGAIALAAAVTASALIAWFAYRRLGGFTGDILGATIVSSETAALLALVT